MDDRDYAQFLAAVKRLSGVDLAQYKQQQMRRRLASFRDRHGFADFATLAAALKRDDHLLRTFLDYVTINVSSFFRNPDQWKVLETRILPRLVRESGGTLACWSAACSTGEEPYSLAMLLLRLRPAVRFEVLATDIDASALARAEEGWYDAAKVQEEVPPALREAFFRQEGNRMRVDERVRRCVRFRRHDLLADPFPTGLDLIVCRNVMIYFTDEAKERLYRQFHDALRPGGVLFVGSTEQIFSPHRYGFALEAPFFYRRAPA